ncbi:hypothetical protein HZH68_016044 [Vespula germanica]|uniref:Uncharacterized protein n=1 Tax=Vespula germanica TaxID=30212 RepID=A0A834MRN4_VESGE|nr:hypothetical protein HZH68_016044 [Vespula germanica]
MKNNKKSVAGILGHVGEKISRGTRCAIGARSLADTTFVVKEEEEEEEGEEGEEGEEEEEGEEGEEEEGEEDYSSARCRS